MSMVYTLVMIFIKQYHFRYKIQIKNPNKEKITGDPVNHVKVLFCIAPTHSF